MSDDEDAPFVQHKKPKPATVEAPKPKADAPKPSTPASAAPAAVQNGKKSADPQKPPIKPSTDADDKPIGSLKPKPAADPTKKTSADSKSDPKAEPKKADTPGTPVKRAEPAVKKVDTSKTTSEKKPTEPAKKPSDGEKKPEGEKKAAAPSTPSASPAVKREKPADDDDVPLSKLKKPAPAPAPTKKDDDDDVPLAALKKTDKTPVKAEALPKVAAKPAAGTKKSPASTPKKATPAKKKKDESSESGSSDDSSSSSSSGSDSDSDSSSSSSGSGSDSSSDSSSSASEDDDKKKRKKPAKAKPAAKKADAAKSPKPKKVKKEGDGDEKGKKRKKATAEDDAGDISKWEKRPKLPEGVKWLTLEHAGVLFPEPYKPHGIPVLYEGKPVQLTPEQEEIATFYSQYLETDHVKKAAFNKNFFEAWQQVLNPDKKGKHVIKELSKVDFSPIRKHLLEQKELKKARSKEEKAREKEEKEEMRKKYGFALVDGVKEKIANYRIEPPGLFLGRGAHPKTGMLKRRIQPEDVTINIGDKASVPVPPPGHKWKKVVHDNKVAWLAFWKEPINNGHKYVWLSAGSRIKGESDMKKFDVARNLKGKIADIRREYESELDSKDESVRQRATAIWIIDHLALRAGNEKDDDSADTVGCCSLRVEHVKLIPPTTVEFDFLGKDSMRYYNTVQVTPAVFRNLQLFKKGKEEGADIFDHLTTTSLNQHLKKYMKGLTAKVFRTYNASITLENELAKGKIDMEDTVEEKVLAFNRANREVAILCNHQRSQPKKHDEQMGKIDLKVRQLQEERDVMEQHIKNVKAGKVKGDNTVIKLKHAEDDDSDDEQTPKKKPKKDEKEVKSEKSDSKDVKSEKSDSKDVKSEKDVKVKIEEKKDELVLPNDVEKVKSRLAKVQARLHAWEIKKTEKEELKTVALSTSKINYIDPRITVAWAKRMGVPLEKVFSKSLREKFTWATVVPPEWHF